MELFNLTIGDKVIPLRYNWDEEIGCFCFTEDICIGNWTIGSYIKIGGPKTSAYKYDFKNYFEFVITDNNGMQRTQRWFHNRGDELLGACWSEGGVIEVLPYFVANHPIFKAANWSDFDASRTITQIRECLNNGTDNTQMLEDIKCICNNI